MARTPTVKELEVEETPLEQAWRRSGRGCDDPSRLARSIANRTDSAARTTTASNQTSARERSRSPAGFLAQEDSTTNLQSLAKSESVMNLTACIEEKIVEVETAVAAYEECQAWCAQRVGTPESERWKRQQSFRKNKKGTKKSKEARGKLLVYAREPLHMQQDIDDLRTKEWWKWKYFEAAVPLSKEEAEWLTAQGVQALPLKRVDTDKSERLNTENPYIAVLHESCLVGRGDLEYGDVRSDSPTIAEESQALIYRYAVAKKLEINTADISNTYF